jgi:hypothetical protein
VRRTLTLAQGVRAQSLRRLLRHKVTCAFCGRRYLPRCLRFVGFDGKLWFFLGACSGCRAVALIGVIPGDEPGSRPEAGFDTGLRPGLSFGDGPSGPRACAREAAGAGERSAVSIDDVLDLHNRLASFDGDFRRLFGLGQLGVDG